MSDRTVAAAILRTLHGAGARTAFGLPGVHNLHFWEPTGDDVPAIVGTRHEQTTVYAADGLARASGGLGVSLTTTGPGVANAAGAFGEAAACGSPVLLISSDTSTAIARPGIVRGGLHESADQAAIFEPLAKAVYRPQTAQAALTAVAEGIATAMQWPRGPVYIGVPTDVLGREGAPVAVPGSERVPPSDAELATAAQLIDAAQRVVIWVGGGAVQADAGDAVGRLADRLGAPVIATWAARGAVGAGHPWLVELPPHEPEATELLEAADLVIAIGTAFDGPNTMNWKLRLPTVLAINADPGDAVKNYPPAQAIIADARETVAGLLGRVAARECDPVAVRERSDRARARIAADADTASAAQLVSAVEGVVARHDPVVVCDMSIGGYWLGGYARFARPRRMQYPVGWGTLGYALPAAVGAGTLDRPALAVCGDGGFMFAVGELAVLAEHELDVTVLVIDDGGYGMLRFDQVAAGEATRGVDLGRPDFAALAAAFGIAAATTDLAGLGDALEAALATPGPRLVVLAQELYPPISVSARWPR